MKSYVAIAFVLSLVILQISAQVGGMYQGMGGMTRAGGGASQGNNFSGNQGQANNNAGLASFITFLQNMLNQQRLQQARQQNQQQNGLNLRDIILFEHLN